jgi:hypothetical protein
MLATPTPPATAAAAAAIMLAFQQAEAAAAAAKVQLPADMIETAKVVGLRSTALSKYLRLQVRGA